MDLNETKKNLNDLAESVESMFERTGEGEDMWRIAGRFAMQLDQGQIHILSLIKFLARKASEPTGKVLTGFYNDYIELQNNRNTALFIAKMAEFDSLKRYFTGIQGQVKIEK